MLDWDREDREADTLLAEKLLQYSLSVREQSLAASLESEMVTKALAEAIKSRDDMVDEVMEVEAKVTEDAIDMEIAYSRTFKRDAARIMLDVLAKIRAEVMETMMRVEMKKYFK